METTLLLLFYIAILITMSVIIINTSSPTKALAYLFLLFTFPFIGILVYLSVGINYRTYKLYNKKLGIDKAAFPELKELIKSYTQEILVTHKKDLQHFLNLAKFIHKENSLASDTKVDLLVNGETKFPEVINALENAKEHIHIEYYIFQNDKIGNQISEILKKKAAQGVKVRLIYDDYGSKNIRTTLVKSLHKSNIEAYPFYKIKWLLFANRINYRNHRKIIIIDGKVGFVGGVNVSDNYINPNNKQYWRDTHIKIEGLAVMNLQRIFLADWNFCSNQNLTVTEEFFPIQVQPNSSSHKQLVQIISSGPDSDHPNIMYAMIQAILLAKKEILITTPYFVPDSSFINAIKIARLSDVTIKILVPYISDSKLVNATSNSYYKELLEIGVEIYRYKKGFIHAKTMVFDGLVSTVGTANLDHRSFDLNFEVNAFIYNSTFSETLSSTFFTDLKDAEQIDLQTWNNRPYYIQFFERVIRLLAPLM
ncbi:cardiolipin synthase [Tenacibaculum sp. TC6]|uniref:cardiolipin synthase n=1 Tax=Tenacibaculum sp. TC6 TaxID=3423223 RepID=UPI003D35D618